jgi:hypothetical protein
MLWSHFLVPTWEVTLTERSRTGAAGPAAVLTRAGDAYSATLHDDTTQLTLGIRASCTVDGKTYPLVQIVQEFTAPEVKPADSRLVARGWRKGQPDDPLGLQKGSPQLHPLLALDGVTILVDVRFVDITDLYADLHGRSSWWRVLRFLSATQRTVRVLAALGGHPLVWYAAIPRSVTAIEAQKPVVLVMPADYGAISYPYSLKGLRVPAHSRSVDNLQSGLEVLTHVLTEPLSDARYNALLRGYLALRRTFTEPVGDQPPPLHHFRSVITYVPEQGSVRPKFWDVPFGFERALEDERSILLMPLMNGGEGGLLIKRGLGTLTRNAITSIYAHGTTLSYATLRVADPVLVAYSQSGGNVFTACARSPGEIRGLALFEPQYMNQALGTEDRHLALGKDVVPTLLRAGVKVVSIGRRKGGWASKYLPAGNAAGLRLLPDDSRYDALITYPATKPYASADVLIRHRYSRLVDPLHDAALTSILDIAATDTYDPPTVDQETKVDAFVEAQRKAGRTDDQLVATVYSAGYDADTSGGYFTHNFCMAGGQSFDTGTRSYTTFFHEALRAIG